MIKIGDCLYTRKFDGYLNNESYLVTDIYYSVGGSAHIILDNKYPFTYEKDDNGRSYADFFKTKKEMREEQLQKLLDL